MVSLNEMFPDSEFTVGRGANNHFVVHHPTVSDCHLRVFRVSESDFLIRDVSGDNITLVDRTPIAIARVDAFKTIMLGHDKYSFSLRQLAVSQSKQGAIGPTDKFSTKNVYHLSDDNIYTIGASPDSDIFIDSGYLCWRYGYIKRIGGYWCVVSRSVREILVLLPGQPQALFFHFFTVDADGSLTVSANSRNRLHIKDVVVRTKTGVKLISGFSLPLDTGKFIAVLGPSGSGKSTLFKAIRGLIPLAEGAILFNDRDITNDRMSLQSIGYVPQDDVVFNDLTVEENVRYACELRLPHDWPKKKIDEVVEKLLETMRLTETRDRLCGSISGGQRRRVNLATEIILDPPFLFADEVCTGLSSSDTSNILEHLRVMADRGTTVVLTVHTPDIEVLDKMDYVLVLDKGGYIAYYGPALPDSIEYFTNSELAAYQSPKAIFDALERVSADGGEKRVIAPEEWHAKYKASPYYEKFICSR